MRILYVLTTLGVGGAEKQVIALAEGMAARGHSVALLVLKHSTAEELPVKLPVMRLNMLKSPGSIWRGLRFARNFLTIFRPEILHSHTFPANLFTRMLGLSYRSAIVLNTIHNVHEGGWHRMLLYGVTDPMVDGVTAVSAAAAERFVGLRAVSKRKMRVLTNGIDADAFASERGRRRRVRREMLAGDGFVWIAVGRLVAAKDYPNLLRAFGRVRGEHPDCELWIAGEGDVSLLGPALLGSGGEGNPDLGMVVGDDVFARDGVRLLGLRRDIVDLLDGADGYVLSSAWEGMPLAVGEAMAMEKPVVATDVGGVRELVGEAGVVVPAGDSDALAGAMLGVMGMEDISRRRLGRAARERIVTHFSLRAKVEEWAAYYESAREAKPR